LSGWKPPIKMVRGN